MPPPEEKLYRSQYGVTLVEILVLTAIILLLIMVGLPALARVQEAGKQSRSTANLRFMASGLMLYCGDHNGYLPESAFDVQVRSLQVRFWFNALTYYLEGESDLRTASRREERPTWQNCPARPFKEAGKYGNHTVSVGYGWNHQFFGNNGIPGGYSDGKGGDIHLYGWRSHLSEVELPADTIIIGTNNEHDAAGVPIAPNNPQNICIYGNNPLSKRFNGAGLYLFVDGHVRRLTPEEASIGGSNGVPERYLFKKKKLLPYPEDKRNQP